MAQQNQTPQSQQAAPSSDAIASIITQVSPTGAQPGRAPARPAKARPAAKSKSKSQKVAQSSTSGYRQPSTTAASSPSSQGHAPTIPNNPGSEAQGQESSIEDEGSKLSQAHDASSTLVGSSAETKDPEKSAIEASTGTTQPAQPARDASTSATASLSQSQQQQPSAQTGKKSKKPGHSPWTSFLMALGCVSRSAHDDDDTASVSSSIRRKSKQKKQGRQGKQQPETQNMPMTQITPPPGEATQQGTSTSTHEKEQELMAPLSVTPTEAAVTSAPGSQGIPLSKEETGNVTSGAVVPPGADGHSSAHTLKKRRSRTSTRTTDSQDETEHDAEGSSEDGELRGAESGFEEDVLNEDEEEQERIKEERIIQAGGIGIRIDEDGIPRPLLMPLLDIDSGRKCLVLDLDETLVHSSFKQIQAADYIVPVEIENQTHNVFVIKRPGVDEFLQRMGEIYEVVVFTASLSKYADPVLDQLDIHKVVRHRLFRESCYNHKGNYVKDLSQLGRPIHDCIIIDNSPASYIFHPKNAVPVSSWFNDPHDTELIDMIGVLSDLADVDDVRSVLDGFLDQ